MQGGNDMAEGMMSTEIIMVPNKMVGLIIGRGGEQITRYVLNDHLYKLSTSSFIQKRNCILHGRHFVIRKFGQHFFNVYLFVLYLRLQADSGCKIQMAQDSAGMPDRQCTLTGSPTAIA